MEDLTQQLEQRRVEQLRNQANKGGQAATFALFQTTGQGAFEFEDCIDFVLAFTEEPFMAYGSSCDADALADLLGMNEEDTPPFPLVSGLVTDWVRDEHGFYLGAYVGVRVHFPSDIPVAADVAVVIRHYFKFEAIGLKGFNG